MMFWDNRHYTACRRRMHLFCFADKRPSATGEKLLNVPVPQGWISTEELERWFTKKESGQSRSPKWDNWIVALTNPVLACLLQRAYTDEEDLTLWDCYGYVEYVMRPNLALCTEMVYNQKARKPIISHLTRVKFGLGCVSKVYKSPVFMNWILDWVSGKDRSAQTAREISMCCSKSVELEQKKTSHAMTAKGAAAWAASRIALAAVAFSDFSMIDNCIRLIDYWVAEAALWSDEAARLEGIDFDLETIAELTLAVR